MIDKQQDFLTLTGAARRARSEGYDITSRSPQSRSRRLHKSRTERITYLRVLPQCDSLSPEGAHG